MDTRKVQPDNTLGFPVEPVRQPVATENGLAGKKTAHEITTLLPERDAGVSR